MCAYSFLPLIILYVKWMDLELCLNKSNPSNKVNSDSFPTLNFIFFIVLNTLLSVYNLNHKADLTTFVALTIVNIKVVEYKEILWFNFYLSTV